MTSITVKISSYILKLTQVNTTKQLLYTVEASCMLQDQSYMYNLNTSTSSQPFDYTHNQLR